jgi:hypothetical protein
MVGVETLRVRFLNWGRLEPAVASALMQSFPNVVNLELRRLKLPSFSKMTNLLLAFPAVKQLKLIRTVWNSKTTGAEPERNENQRVVTFNLMRSLTVHALSEEKTRCREQLLLWFMDGHLPPICSLHLKEIDTIELPTIQAFLQALGPRLTSLELDFCRFTCSALSGFRNASFIG